jgi:hypothetical protein
MTAFAQKRGAEEAFAEHIDDQPIHAGTMERISGL